MLTYVGNIKILTKTDSKVNNIIQKKIRILYSDIPDYPREFMELFCFTLEKKAKLNNKEYNAFLKGMEMKANNQYKKDLGDYGQEDIDDQKISDEFLKDIINEMRVYKDIYGNIIVFDNLDINKMYPSSMWKIVGDNYCIQHKILQGNNEKYCEENNLVYLKCNSYKKHYINCNCYNLLTDAVRF